MRHILLGLMLAVLTIGEAAAERYVIVNGQRLTDPELMRLERYACTPISNGNYWLDMSSGRWGNAGNPRPMGHVRYCCFNQCRRPSLSERGLLLNRY